MWTIDVSEIRTFQSNGGAFTELVDSLLRAEAYVCGVSDSAIATNCRMFLPDGGVDSAVHEAIVSSPSGWFPDATCWQYKASPFGGISEGDLKTEIRKPFAAQLIGTGSAYRFCIADSLTPEKRTEWEAILSREARALNAAAPACRVVTADDLATWASRMPGVIIRFFRPQLSELQHLESWGQSERALTRTFVEVPGWAAVSTSVLNHVHFDTVSPDAVLWLQGESGVGKTRMVYEALASRPSARGLVVYTRDDETAVRLAAELANDPAARALLIADECPLESRAKIEAMLVGHRHRVRVIAVDNVSDSVLGLSPQLRLDKMPDEKTDQVLAVNFPGISADRRREYARVSRGFVRLAADLCKNNHLIEQTGDLGAAVPAIARYLWLRIAKEEDQNALLAISLVTRVGCAGDLTEELTALATLVGRPRERLLDSARRIKDSTGFIAQGGRYLYVTPEILAVVAFQAAWERWVRLDPASFLGRIPPELLDRFQKRVSHSANADAREVVALFFRDWFLSVNPSDLTDLDKVERLAGLIETAPAKYLSSLGHIVTRASEHELLAISGDHSSGRWGPRRVLVWLLEKLAAFPEYFSDAEEILLKLALAESEPSIANNATGVWRELFQIVLSGTATPFGQRMDLLRKRLFDNEPCVRELALQALNASLRSFSGATRSAGSKTLGGRLMPDEWRPKPSEGRQCLEMVQDLIEQISGSEIEALRNAGIEICIKNGRRFIADGDLPFLTKILSKENLPARLLPRLVEMLDDSLGFDLSGERRPQWLEPAYVQLVRKWRADLIPSDLHGRILGVIGVDPWHHPMGDREDIWRQDVARLAAELHTEPGKLLVELDWLFSDEARSAAVLGAELGRLDARAVHLEVILAATVKPQRNLGLAKTYLANLIAAYPDHLADVNLALDRIWENPEVGYELTIVCGRPVRSLRRTLDQIEAGRLKPSHLQSFITGYGPNDPLTRDELGEVLQVLFRALKDGDESAASVAVGLIGYRVAHRPQPELEVLGSDVLNLIFETLITTAKSGGGDSYWWGRSLSALASVEPLRVARAASLGLCGEYFQKEESGKILVDLAGHHPEEVMQSVGAMMLDEESGIQFFVGHYRGLFSALPLPVVSKWLLNAGVAGARKLARHLPPPYIDAAGNPIVPQLTELVLEKFEDDDRTFAEFCAGTYSSGLLVGNFANQFLAEGETARHFLTHPLRRVRQWAAERVESAGKNAAQWRQFQEERDLD
jgi:hypothetical protein